MLHPAQDDLIAGLQPATSITLRDQIDGLGGAANKNNFIRAGGVDQSLYFGTRRFKSIGGQLTEGVDAAMYISVVVLVIIAFGRYYRHRLLCRSSVVQVNQRLAVDFCFQNGKVRSPELYLKFVGISLQISKVHDISLICSACGKRSSTSCSIRERICGISTRLIISLAKP